MNRRAFITTMAAMCLVRRSFAASSSPQVLIRDLEYLHSSLRANYSGCAYSETVRQAEAEAFTAAMGRAAACTSSLQHRLIVKRYLASFHDRHVNGAMSTTTDADLLLAGRRPPPGIMGQGPSFVAVGVIMKRYGGRFIVVDVDQGILGRSDIRPGDELVEYEGQPPAVALEDGIMPYESFADRSAASINLAPRLFFRWDRAAGDTCPCGFRRGERTFEVRLPWVPVQWDYLRARHPKLPLYGLEKTAYGHWITLRSLYSSSPQEQAQLARFVEDAASLRNDRVVVIDVRGNSGGVATWGMRWIKGLFGYVISSDNTTEFLCSPDNIRFYERVYAIQTAAGGDVENLRTVKQILDIMHAHPEGFAALPSGATGHGPVQAPLFRGRLYVLTDSAVFSSAEIFVEALRQMPGVVCAGLPTDASTIFSEARGDVTPSGLNFIYPVTVDTTAHRRSGEPLYPDLRLAPDPALDLAGRDSMREALENIIAR